VFAADLHSSLLPVGRNGAGDPSVRSRDDVLAPDVMLQGLIAPGTGAQRLQSHFRHGAFAERMLLPLENVVPLHGLPVVDAAQLTWLNTLLVPYGGLFAGGLQPGQTVIVNGASGHFGSAGVTVALAMGAECVVATGLRQGALQALVDRLGPRIRRVVMTGEEEEDIEALRRAAGRAADLLLDMLNPIRTFTPVRTAIMAMRPGGTAVLMGGVQADIAIPYRYIMRNSITIRGQYMYPRQAPAQLVGLIRAGILSLDPFTVSCFPLEKANEAVQYAAEHGGAFRSTVLTVNK
jgi:alcohol dehydrogenase